MYRNHNINKFDVNQVFQVVFKYD